MDVSIRPAEEQDLQPLLRLLPQLSSRPASAAAQLPDPERAAEILRRLLRREDVTLLAAVDARHGAIVGTLTLVQVPNLTYGGRPWSIVENVVVDRSHRRQGVGRRLMTRAMELAEAGGCYKVQLLSGTGPEQARFYASLGFDGSGSAGYKRYFG
jgi:GNAT superfamily N-acetyltransferase